MKKITLALLLLSSFITFAQRTCGMEAKMQQIMADPIQREAYLQKQQEFEVELHKLENAEYRSSQSVNTETIRIPVAVHFPAAGTASAVLKNCLKTLAQSQINTLNADYNAANSDLYKWDLVASMYPMVTSVGNMNIQFELATQNHPAGTGLAEGAVAVTFGTDFLSGEDTDYTWAGYVNFVVRDEGDSILGYSPLGGQPGAGYTVVLNNFAFGSGSGCSGSVYRPYAPYNLGRTLTHELGHYFNLNHTFGSCGTNCNVTGDRICDTPAVMNPTYECPIAGSVNGCVTGQKALTMNYMDYVNDACMFMFTLGQENRMRAWYNTIASDLNMTTLSNINFVKNNYSLAPNPNNGSFTLTFKDLSNDISVEVFDISGRVVYENYFTQTANLVQDIKIENPSSGLYFVNIKSGSSIATEKIIIK